MPPRVAVEPGMPRPQMRVSVRNDDSAPALSWSETFRLSLAAWPLTTSRPAIASTLPLTAGAALLTLTTSGPTEPVLIVVVVPEAVERTLTVSDRVPRLRFRLSTPE